MNKHTQFYLCLLILILAQTACSGNQSNTNNLYSNLEMPDIGIPAGEINSRFQIITLEAKINQGIYGSIVLQIKVLSDDQIAFQADYGSRIYRYENNQWIQLIDFYKHGQGAYIFDKNSWGAGTTMGVAPILPDPAVESFLRIILIGNIYRNGKTTDEQTAAYTDVLLRP